MDILSFAIFLYCIGIASWKVYKKQILRASFSVIGALLCIVVFTFSRSIPDVQNIEVWATTCLNINGSKVKFSHIVIVVKTEHRFPFTFMKDYDSYIIKNISDELLEKEKVDGYRSKSF